MSGASPQVQRSAIVGLYGPGLRDPDLGLDKWPECPICGDPGDGTYPLALDDHGRLSCSAHHCDPELLAAAVTAPGAGDTYSLLTVDELLSAPPPSWLIDDVFPEGLAVLHGPPGAYKSFLALDWSLSVAAGLPWHDHVTTQAWVLYVAAEGRGGLGQRVRAWIDQHPGADLTRFRLLADTVSLLEPAAVEQVSRTVDGLPQRPGLLVVDTLARSMPGGDENHARDVGAVIAAVDRLRGERSALVVHHDRKDGQGERGSGALRGAADLMVGLERKKGVRSVMAHCEKLKDAEEWPPLRLVPTAAAHSLVLSVEPADTAEGPFRPTGYMERVSRALETREQPASKNEVETLAGGKRDYVRQALALLVEEGYVGRVTPSSGAAQSILHESLRPFREDPEHPDLAPSPQPRPDLAPGEGSPPRPTSPSPSGEGRGEGEQPATTTSPRLIEDAA